MKSSTRRSSTAPATSMKPSTRSSTSKKLSTRLTTAMKSSPRRCMIPHIPRNGLSPGRSSIRVEIAAPKPSQRRQGRNSWLQTPVHKMPSEGMNKMVAQGEADTDENQILDSTDEDYEFEWPEENESWLQTPVHKMASEGMNKMVAQGEADTDENQILDSTNEELSVAAMSDLLNVLEEDVPGLQKPLPKKASEGTTKMAVQGEACTWRNSKLFKLFDALSKSERHKLYPTVVCPPKDREPLLYDFFGYDYYFEDDVSKATDGGASSSSQPRYNLRTRRSRTNTKN